MERIIKVNILHHDKIVHKKYLKVLLNQADTFTLPLIIVKMFMEILTYTDWTGSVLSLHSFHVETMVLLSKINTDHDLDIDIG